MKRFLILILLFPFLLISSCKKDDNPTQPTTSTSCAGIPTVTYAGKTYNTVQIGSQCWLKENLDVGDVIQVSQKQTDNGVIEKYCYDNNTANCNTYGGLYQWDEAMQYVTTQGTQGICPSGWHIPTYTEFQTLDTYVNNDGNALKAIGQGIGGGVGTNTSGFSALLTGNRFPSGYFGYLGSTTYFWISTEDTASYNNYLGLSLNLRANYSGIFFIDASKNYGLSVRCLKD